jgi:hypothetical protein
VKTALRLVLAGILALVAITLIRYRHVDPCKALEREIVREVEHGMQVAADSVQAVVVELGEATGQAVEGVSDAVQDATVGLAQAAAEIKVQRMSKRECVVELWEMAKDE